MNIIRNLIVCSTVMLLTAQGAFAFINPNFTPIDLVNQSQLLLVLKFSPANDQGIATATVQRIIKGDLPEGKLNVDLLAGAFDAQGQLVMGLIEQGATQGLLFAGAYENQNDEMDDPDILRHGYLHIAGQWIVVSEWEQGLWEMEKIEPLMLGTWAGGTDMLLRAVNYVIADPYASIPINSGVMWDDPINVGVLQTDVTKISAIDVAGRAIADLYIPAASGDKIYRWSNGSLHDVTAKSGLNAASSAFVWADFDRNGTLDLASYHEQSLTIHFQSDKQFVARKYDIGDIASDNYVQLATIDNGEGRPAIVMMTSANITIVSFNDAGDIKTQVLLLGEMSLKSLGDSTGCLVADMDNDGIPDIIHLFANGSIYYQGITPATFKLPIPCPIAAGRGRSSACLGDYDADGLLDVFIAGENKNSLWHNKENAFFIDKLAVSGEISYIAKPGGVAVQTADINNDGRQDVFIAYSTQLAPHLFFNRGFRSFGHARMVDLAEQGILPQAGEGQLAGALGDFNGDGAMDLALLLANGQLWVLPRKIDQDSALVALAYIPLGTSSVGPVNVWATKDEQSLPAWPVRAGDVGAFFGAIEPGPIIIHWRLDDGSIHNKEVIVEDGPIRVDISVK